MGGPSERDPEKCSGRHRYSCAGVTNEPGARWPQTRLLALTDSAAGNSDRHRGLVGLGWETPRLG